MCQATGENTTNHTLSVVGGIVNVLFAGGWSTAALSWLSREEVRQHFNIWLGIYLHGFAIDYQL
jgi:hypothetical protein